jgi:hypothetical protein
VSDDLAEFLRAADLAMKLEGIGPIEREHVINRLVYGDPHGPRARYKVSESGQTVQINITEAPGGDFAQRVRQEAQRLGNRIGYGPI